jgi:hypothetical protein
LGGGTSGSCSGQTVQASGKANCVAMSENAGLGCLLFQSAALSATPPTATGTPTCSASFTGSQQADTDAVLGCKPARCTTDYCGLRSHGFQTCIVHDGDPSGTCPSGFHPAFCASVATAPGNVVVACDPFSCTMSPPGACTGTVRVFAAGNAAQCDGDGGTNGLDYKETLAADGTCRSTGICAYDGVFYVPDSPPPTVCTPATPSQTNGHVSLTSASTICCAP